jgi:hypothetical protein
MSEIAMLRQPAGGDSFLVLRPCPAGDAPASLCPPQRYRKYRVGFLNGFPMLLVLVGRWSHKIRAISGDIDGPRRAQRSGSGRNG